MKYRKIIRYVLGAETFGLADACDSAIVIQNELKHGPHKRLKTKILTGNEKFFKVLIRNATTTGRTLMSDIIVARRRISTGLQRISYG